MEVCKQYGENKDEIICLLKAHNEEMRLSLQKAHNEEMRLSLQGESKENEQLKEAMDMLQKQIEFMKGQIEAYRDCLKMAR